MTKHKTASVLKVLDYTKNNKAWFDEKNMVAGYHTVSIQGETFLGQRNPSKRLEKVPYDFTNKRVLDVGCSNGGLLHALTNQIAFGVGVDFNSKCVNAANALKAVNNTDNIHFYTFDLDKEDLSMLTHFILGEKVDICFFFNISLWVKRWKDVFRLCSTMTTRLLFESHGTLEQQKAQLDFVLTIYKDVVLLSDQSDDDPTYANRKMYLCENRVESKAFLLELNGVTLLDRLDSGSIQAAYENAFSDQVVKNIHLFPNTHESVVADINHQYILKLPRPSRGGEGLIAEAMITDYIRDKIHLPIPKFDIVKQPVLMGRYAKIQGDVFDANRYDNLPVESKNQLAGTLASLLLDFHAVHPDEIVAQKIPLAPSWNVSLPLIKEQLFEEKDWSVVALLEETLSFHTSLVVPDYHKVFGHFDLHGGNLLLDTDHVKVNAVIDFGNCKIGDFHQDLSTMYLSSPDLAERIIEKYQALSGRQVDRSLVWHYTTIFYLNLLAGLKSNQASQYGYWLTELKNWHHGMLRKRASQQLASRDKESSVPHEWRTWLASNLIKGSNGIDLQKVLIEQGFSPMDSALDVLIAENHPYIEAGKNLFQELNKRHWLLKTCDSLAAVDVNYNGLIEKRQAPSFDEFLKKYYSKNLPVILTGAIDHWPALTKWTPEYFLKNFGNKEIEIQQGRDQDPLFERNSVLHKNKIVMSEFIKLIQNGESNDHYMTANNAKGSYCSLSPLFDDVSDFSSGYRSKDTMDTTNLLWFGPKGTFTPLHHDLTNNMLVQIYGRKKITLIPALQVPYLYNDKGVYSAAEYPNFDATRYPALKNVTPITVLLSPGDSLFIPIGWWHCVESLDVSISLSFTNFNAPNHFHESYPKGT